MSGNRLKAAAEKLRAGMRRHAAVNVTVQRNGGSAVSCPAIAGKSVFHSSGENGVFVNTEYTDFIIGTDDFPYEPAPGMTIAYGGKQYEVSPPPDGSPCWRWSDSFQLARRIHARLKEE